MNARKFTFDTEFRAEGDLVSNAARARQKKVYSQEEIDHLCAKARGEGIKAGQVRAAEALVVASEALADALRQSLAEAGAIIEGIRKEACELAYAAATKLAPMAIAALPQADVDAALREAIHQAIGEPRIVLRAPQPVLDALAGKLADIAHEEGFDGRIVAMVDSTLSGSDCRIEWRGGGAERSYEALAEEIGMLIQRRFSPQQAKG
jgi:flagellar biosynthesis/type III secretory pathway protein FliH